MAITDFSQLDMTKQYTWSDYLSWQFQERVELLGGYAAKMSPAPSSFHQNYSANIHGSIWSFFKKKRCKTYAAPIDVFLNTKDKKSVVQPDVIVVCDLSKIESKGCVGAPDIAVEILLPGNSKKEMHDKYDLYEEAGVKEYWAVFPEERVVQIFNNVNGKFTSRKPLANGDIITTPILEGFEIEVDDLFAE